VIDLGEIENTFKVKRVVSVYMDVEQGLFVISEYFLVELVVILVLALGGRFEPKRIVGVYSDWRIFLGFFLFILSFYLIKI